MPTMAKLFSAILLGALGYGVADQVGGHLPPEQTQGALRNLTAFFGVLVGWRFLGAKVRGEWSQAIGLGISAVVLLAVIALFWFAGYEMIQRAMRLIYGGDPILALEDMFFIAVEYLQYLAQVDVIIVAGFGAVILGFVVTAVSRMWR